MDKNIRFVPIQDICTLCDGELSKGDTTLLIDSIICRACLRFVMKQQPREGVMPTKFVTVR